MKALVSGLEDRHRRFSRPHLPKSLFRRRVKEIEAAIVFLADFRRAAVDRTATFSEVDTVAVLAPPQHDPLCREFLGNGGSRHRDGGHERLLATPIEPRVAPLGPGGLGVGGAPG